MEITGAYFKNNYNLKLHKSTDRVKALADKLKLYCTSSSKKAALGDLINYLTVVLRSNYSGLLGDPKIQYSDVTGRRGNYKVTREGVSLYLRNVISNQLTDTDAEQIIGICT
ncbi:MAG: hypothetical protein ACK4M7_07055, partial [Burkholderiales bacterium]